MLRGLPATRVWSLGCGWFVIDGILVRFGVERFDAMGERFDPAVHEAVATTSVDEPALVGSVMHQATPGYRFGGKLLRAAMVNVGVASREAKRPRKQP